MKKIFLLTLFIMVLTPSGSFGQSSLKDILGNIFSASSNKTTTEKTTASSSDTKTTDVLSSVFKNVIGTKNVTCSTLVGTWKYSQPAVAFSSQNLLNQAGGTLVANAVQKKLGQTLSQYGFTAGISTFTFASDSTFTAKLKNKNIKGKYAVSGSTVTFYSSMGVKLATANASIKNNALQMTFKADKLLTFAQYASSLSQNSTLAAISSIAKKYDGMQMGMQFSK